MAALENPILTQEQLDEIIGRRLREEKERTERKYADYEALKTANAELTGKLTTLEEAATQSAKKQKETEDQIAQYQGKIAKYETDSAKTRIALSFGIPIEMASRLTGSTEDEIEKDAQSLAAFLRPKAKQPMAEAEPLKGKEDDTHLAYKRMLKQMNGGNE